MKFEMDTDNTINIDFDEIDNDKMLILTGNERLKYFLQLSTSHSSPLSHKKISVLHRIKNIIKR